MTVWILVYVLNHEVCVPDGYFQSQGECEAAGERWKNAQVTGTSGFACETAVLVDMRFESVKRPQ